MVIMEVIKRGFAMRILNVNFFSAVLFFSVLLSFSGVHAQDKTFTERLKDLEKQGRRQELFTTSLNPKGQDEFVQSLDFYKERILGGVTDTGYHASYSQLLWHAGIKDTSAMMASSALLILYVDKARCADKTAGETRIHNTFEALRAPLEFLRSSKFDDKNKILKVAFGIESQIRNRRPNRSLCYSGMESTKQAIELIEAGKVPAQKGANGRVLIPNIPSIKVEYIPDSEWLSRRNKIRDGFSSYFD